MSFFKNLFSGNNSKESDVQADFTGGDIFYTRTDGKYNLYKLLVIDTDTETYHILMYAPLDQLPGEANLDSLQVYVYHAPFDKKAFNGATLLTNKPVTANDLTGYHEYLQQTQTPNYYVPIANSYYKLGLKLTDEKKHHEAIDAYSKAIDLFPQFFEAIDNRAFCKMDQGFYAEAIKDFMLSLQLNPNSLLAVFSMGECYYKMRDFRNAKRQFEIAQLIDPSHPAPRQYLDKVNYILNE